MRSYAAGLSLIFGIMRLVNLAHGDLIVLAAFLILALATALGLDPLRSPSLIAVPLMFALGYRAADVCCSTARSAATSCRRCSSPSACRSSSRTACCEAFSADSRRLPLGAIETAVDRRSAAASRSASCRC